MRRTLAALLTAAACAALASPAHAIVGGTDAPAGKYPSVANVVISGMFGCTGTLIAPDWVLTAGHCSSLSGSLGVATPAAYPPSSFQVTVGTVAASGAGGEQVSVDRVVVPGQYTLTQGYDTSLLHLAAPARTAPTPVAGKGFAPLFAARVLTEVAGFGVTQENGDPPATLQQVRIPIVPDPTCAETYSSFEPATQLCGGYDEGGKDSCQGDSGGPMFSRTVAGRLLVVGATSYGNGCAKPKTPGVYARVADATLREFIRANAPGGVADAAAGEDTRPLETYDPATRTVARTSTTPGSGTAATTGATGRLTASLAADRTRRSTFRTRGLRFRLRCSAACTARVSLRVSATTARRLGRSSTVLASTTVRRAGAGRSTGLLRLGRALARRLSAGRGEAVRLTASVRSAKGGPALALRRTAVLTGR